MRRGLAGLRRCEGRAQSHRTERRTPAGTGRNGRRARRSPASPGSPTAPRASDARCRDTPARASPGVHVDRGWRARRAAGRAPRRAAVRARPPSSSLTASPSAAAAPFTDGVEPASSTLARIGSSHASSPACASAIAASTSCARWRTASPSSPIDADLLHARDHRVERVEHRLHGSASSTSSIVLETASASGLTNSSGLRLS